MSLRHTDIEQEPGASEEAPGSVIICTEMGGCFSARQGSEQGNDPFLPLRPLGNGVEPLQLRYQKRKECSHGNDFNGEQKQILDRALAK